MENSDISEPNPWPDSVKSLNGSDYTNADVPENNVWNEINNEFGATVRPKNSESKHDASILNHSPTDGNSDSQSDFGSFESTKSLKAPFISNNDFMNQVNKLFSTDIHPIECGLKGNTHIDNNYLRSYEKLTLPNRTYPKDKTLPINCRPRVKFMKSQIYKELVRICREWSLIESGLDGCEVKDKEEDQKRMNIFQWSSRIDKDTDESENNKNELAKRQKRHQELNRRRLSSKLLGVASLAAGKIVSDRQKQEQIERQLALKERQKREIRLNEEKVKKQLVAERYKIVEKEANKYSSKKKGFFFKMFGRKSKIARDHLSAENIYNKDDPADPKPCDDKQKDLLFLVDEFDGLQTGGESDLEDDDKKRQRRKKRNYTDSDDDDDDDDDSIAEGQYNQLTGIDGSDLILSKEGEAKTGIDKLGLDDGLSNLSDITVYASANVANAQDASKQSLSNGLSAQIDTTKSGQLIDL